MLEVALEGLRARRIQAIAAVSAAAKEAFAEQIAEDTVTFIARETEKPRRLIQRG